MIINEKIREFEDFLHTEEKSKNTIEKYIHDVTAFCSYAKEQPLSKKTAVEYKEMLLNRGYAISSINSMIASINSFFMFIGMEYIRLKSIKEQKKIFCSEEKELTKSEYERLVHTAECNNNHRLSLIIQTICGTGIRVSELEYITIEAIQKGKAVVSCKGKRRVIFIVKNLQKKLLQYAKERGIRTGSIFITRNGHPISRTNIWRDMKKLCKKAQVNPDKVFPHNLRHLFARVFYSIEKDIAKLADILGHSNMNTTRIYIMSTGAEHRSFMEQMRLII